MEAGRSSADTDRDAAAPAAAIDVAPPHVISTAQDQRQHALSDDPSAVNNRVVLAYRAAAQVARLIPPGVLGPLSAAVGHVLGSRSDDSTFLLGRHLDRVHEGLTPRERTAAARQAYASYVRYWLESFRLPYLSRAALDDGFDYRGYDHIVSAREGGNGVIVALPHLGGWEWAAFWLTQIEGVPVSAVVEAVEPPELFEWFREFRERLGINVIALGPSAAGEVSRALGRGEIVCLLSDRDIGASSVDVEFFGEQTKLPAGPATLAIRAGVEILPCAVYFRPGGRGHLIDVRPPLDTSRAGKLRQDVARITQDLANVFEDLIATAPEQWHLLQPNWPSDDAALAARHGTHPA